MAHSNDALEAQEEMGLSQTRYETCRCDCIFSHPYHSDSLLSCRMLKAPKGPRSIPGSFPIQRLVSILVDDKCNLKKTIDNEFEGTDWQANLRSKLACSTSIIVVVLYLLTM